MGLYGFCSGRQGTCMEPAIPRRIGGAVSSLHIALILGPAAKARKEYLRVATAEAGSS